MFATVTVKLEAESKGELVDHFASSVQAAHEHWEKLHKDGAFGPPDSVEMRYLVIGGKWRPKSGEELELEDEYE